MSALAERRLKAAAQKPRWLLIASCVVAAFLLSLVFATRIGSASQQLTIASATPEQLAYGGIKLTSPGNVQPTITQKRAIEIATARDSFGDIAAMGGVREVVLADVEYSKRTHTLSRLSWVVDMTPPGGLPVPDPIGGKLDRDTWFFVFVDARSGEIILAEGGSG